MKSKGCDFGTYNKLSYRICYGLTNNGKIDYSIPLYEFQKNCKCISCSNRWNYEGKLRNNLTVTTDDTKQFSEVEKMIEGYACGSNAHIGRKYVTMRNGCKTEKICK